MTPTRRILAATAGRWALFNAAILLALWHTSWRLAHEALNGSLVSYVYVMIVLASIAALALARRRSDELPIHDRQTDMIVGGMGMLLALAIMLLLVPRYSDNYELLHLDGYAGLIFMISAATLLFGLRAVTVFWPVWVCIFAFNPFPYRLMTLMLGGQPASAGAVMVLVAAVFSAIAVGRDRRRMMLAAAFTLILGAATLAGLLTVFPHTPRMVLQSVPALVAGIVIPLAFFLYRRTGQPKRLIDRDITPLTVREIGPGIATILVAAVALFLAELPPQTTLPIAPAPNTVRMGEPLVTPAGWLTTGLEHPADVRALFGPDADLVRQRVVAEQGSFQWDSQGRPRIASIDLLSITETSEIQVYPEGSLYGVTGTRRSPDISVDLGHGVSARLYTVVDENLLLTWTKLVFMWSNTSVIQRVTILTVDDHRTTATFPTPGFSLGSYINNLFSIMIRGNAIAIDHTPNVKDHDLITMLGRELVAAQYARVP